MKKNKLEVLSNKYGKASYNLTDKEVNKWDMLCAKFAYNDAFEEVALSVRFIKDMPNLLSVCNVCFSCGFRYHISIGLKPIIKTLDTNFIFLHELGHFFLFRYDDKFLNKTYKKLPESIIREYQADMIADFLSRKYNIKIQTKSKLFNLSSYGFFNLFIKEKNKSFYRKVLEIKNETYKAIEKIFNNPDDTLKQLDKKLKIYKPGKDFYIK